MIYFIISSIIGFVLLYLGLYAELGAVITTTCLVFSFACVAVAFYEIDRMMKDEGEE